MFPTVHVNSKDLAASLQKSQINSAATPAGGKAFIRFDFRTGNFTYGRDHDDITGQRIVVNTASIKHGWVLWHNGTPNKVLHSFIEALPPMPPAMGDDEASESRAFEARFEDDPETLLVFETSSYGGRKGVDLLLQQCQAQAVKNPEYLFPIVELEAETPYKAKTGAVIHNPHFHVVGWVNANGEELDAPTQLHIEDAIDEEEQEEAPQLRTRRRRG